MTSCKPMHIASDDWFSYSKTYRGWTLPNRMQTLHIACQPVGNEPLPTVFTLRWTRSTYGPKILFIFLSLIFCFIYLQFVPSSLPKESQDWPSYCTDLKSMVTSLYQLTLIRTTLKHIAPVLIACLVSPNDFFIHICSHCHVFPSSVRAGGCRSYSVLAWM